MLEYMVKRTSEKPELKGLWNGTVWGTVELLEVACFHPKSSDHHPKTYAKLLYDDLGIYGIFKVHDRYVRSVATEFQGDVWKDSCVEFFVQPKGADGYFNFEMNCGGTLLLHYNRVAFPIGDDARTEPVTAEVGDAVSIYHSLPQVIHQEITTETIWLLEFAIPFTVLSQYTGEISRGFGTSWRANLYKCADKCSHPHWASWAKQGELLDFHQEEFFGFLNFI